MKSKLLLISLIEFLNFYYLFFKAIDIIWKADELMLTPFLIKFSNLFKSLNYGLYLNLKIWES